MDASDVMEPQTENAGASESRPFQFSNASTLTTARQESLETWHRNFLKLTSGSLSTLLRLELELELESVKIQTYGEMVKERAEENQCVLFRMHPQPGIWLLDLPVALTLVLVDRMMGGTGSAPKDPARELTELDQIIFQQFADTFLNDYGKSWRPHADLKPEILRQVRNLNYQLIHQSDELMLCVGINVTFKGNKSTMWLIVPIVSVEDLLLKSLAGADRAQQESDRAAIKDKKSPMGGVPVPVSIRWQGFQLTLRDVEAMTPGDVLMLDNKKCESAAVWLGDRAKFVGRLVRDQQKTTVTITSSLE